MGKILQVRRTKDAEPDPYQMMGLRGDGKRLCTGIFVRSYVDLRWKRDGKKGRTAHHDTSRDRDRDEAKTKLSRDEKVKRDSPENRISMERISRISARGVLTLTGMPGFQCLRDFNNLVNVAGIADNLVFYGDAQTVHGVGIRNGAFNVENANTTSRARRACCSRSLR